MFAAAATTATTTTTTTTILTIKEISKERKTRRRKRTHTKYHRNTPANLRQALYLSTSHYCPSVQYVGCCCCCCCYLITCASLRLRSSVGMSVLVPLFQHTTLVKCRSTYITTYPCYISTTDTLIGKVMRHTKPRGNGAYIV